MNLLDRVQAHYKIKKQNTLRNASIPHEFVFDFALYLENRIWKIQKYQMVKSKDINHADRDIRGSYL